MMAPMLKVTRLRCEATPFACRMTRWTAAALLLVATAGAATSSARADVSVEGDIRGVRLHASHAPVSEALSALGTAFNLRYRTSIALDRRLHGTYSGRLDQVIAGLLDGYNYYVVYKNEGAEVVILGKPGIAVAVATPKAAPRVVDAEWEQTKARHRRPPAQR